MKNILRPACLASLFVLGACGGTAPPVPPSPAPAPDAGTVKAPASETAPTDASVQALDIAVDTSTRTPHMLASGDSIQTTIVAPATAYLRAVSVQIGNFEGKSDGVLSLKACQSTTCATGEASLEGSVDNASVEIPLAQPLSLVEGQAMTIELDRKTGFQPFAIWVYPRHDEAAASPDSQQGQPMPKLTLHLAAK